MKNKTPKMANSMTWSQALLVKWVAELKRWCPDGAWSPVTSYPLQSDAPGTAGSCGLQGGGAGPGCSLA